MAEFDELAEPRVLPDGGNRSSNIAGAAVDAFENFRVGASVTSQPKGPSGTLAGGSAAASADGSAAMLPADASAKQGAKAKGVKLTTKKKAGAGGMEDREDMETT